MYTSSPGTLSQILFMLSSTDAEYVWEFQNNALWDAF